MKIHLLLFFVIVIISQGQAQNLPVVKASSPTVDIRDGIHYKKGYWAIMPERKPDYYYVEIPAKEHEVTFITDIDSISFHVEYGKHYDFIILLNNKDSCYTRISSTYKQLNTYNRNHQAAKDSIPFTIGDNSKIYFQGKLNGTPLRILFDLGAGGAVIKKSSTSKVTMNFDDTVLLHNSDGSNQVPASRYNEVQIAGLRWDSVHMSVANNLSHREDIIVGNSLFKNKIIEINYDKKMFIVHDSLPFIDSSYTRQDMILDYSTIPYIKGELNLHSNTSTGWFMFDTGAYTTTLPINKITKTDKWLAETGKLVGFRQQAFIPQLTVGEHNFNSFNYKIGGENHDPQRMGVLGNDLLKRFNVIIDNQTGYIYLKSNSLLSQPFAHLDKEDPYYMVRILVGCFVGLLLLAIGFLIFKKRVSFFL